MKFIKAYLRALRFTACLCGTIYLVLSVLSGESLMAMYLAYVCLVASLAGPIEEAFKK